MTPIQRLIRLNPTPVIILTTAPDEYDPAAEEDYVPGAEIQTWTHGAFSGVKQDGADFEATLTIEALPPFVSTTGSRVRLAEGDYGIQRIRTRRLFGEISGYTLELGP